MFTEIDDPDKSVHSKKNIPHTDHDYEYEYAYAYAYDSIKKTQTNAIIDGEELSPFGDNSFCIQYAADIIARVSREASKRFDQEQLTFLYASSLIAKDNGMKLPFLSKSTSFCGKCVRDNLGGLTLTSSFVLYQSQYGPEGKHKFLTETLVEVLEYVVSLADVRQVLMRS